jgi:hypothetical protein
MNGQIPGVAFALCCKLVLLPAATAGMPLALHNPQCRQGHQKQHMQHMQSSPSERVLPRPQATLSGWTRARHSASYTGAR